MSRTVEWFLAGVILVLVTGLSAAFQTPLAVNEGKGVDGVYYFEMAEQAALGRPLQTHAPFVFRPGTPWLAAQLNPSNLMDGFARANLVGNTLAVVFLLLWLGCFVADPRLRLFLIGLYVTHPLGPVRFTHLYPTSIDPWSHAALFAVLWTAQRYSDSGGKAWGIACALGVFLGVWFRDVVVLIPAVYVFFRNPLRRDCPLMVDWERLRQGLSLMVVPLLAGVIAVVMTRFSGHQTDSYSLLHTFVRYAFDKPFLTWLLAWAIVFGPLLFFVLFSRRARAWILDRQPLALLVLGFGVLSWIGGADTERILFWTAPVMYVAMARSLEDWSADLRRAPWLVALFAAAQALAHRLWWPIPNAQPPYELPVPLLTPIGGNVPYQSLFGWHSMGLYDGSVMVVGLWLMQYFVLAAVLLMWRRCSHYRSGLSSS